MPTPKEIHNLSNLQLVKSFEEQSRQWSHSVRWFGEDAAKEDKLLLDAMRDELLVRLTLNKGLLAVC